jgi:hypothetical protein
MYSLLYRNLPGGKVTKVFLLIALAVAALALLFFLVFPFVDSLMPEDPSING